MAARLGHTDTVAELMRLGADSNAKNQAWPIARARARVCDRRPLADEASPPRLDVLVLFDLRNQSGGTALLLAASWGRTTTVNALVRLGADINGRSDVRVHPMQRRGVFAFP
jgi:ankyrin repeat protein